MHTLLLVLWIVAIALIMTGAITAIITLYRARSARNSHADQAFRE